MNVKLVPERVLTQVATLLGADIESIRKKSPEFTTSTERCDSCNREFDFYDFVKTAYSAGVHSKEYMADFFLGSESMKKEIDLKITCSSCNKTHPTHVTYTYTGPKCKSEH